MDVSRYQAWRSRKLSRGTGLPPDPVIRIHNPGSLSARERQSLRESVARAGFAIYALPQDAESRTEACIAERLVSLCRQVGLTDAVSNPAADDDGISRIEAVPATPVAGARDRARYIPYSSQRLNWHTDGYYYPDSRRVRSFALHCVRDAGSGGDNRLLDGEMLYLLLRDHCPRLAAALCHPEAMTIPGDRGAGGSGRATFRGPVFEIDPLTGALYTRYTRRRHHIGWRDDAATREALAFLGELLDSDHPAITRWRLSPGEGLLCNNVLHCRTTFTDREEPGRGRLFYRLRFHQRIDTGEAGW